MAKKKPPETAALKGWTAIAAYLGLPVSTVHRWARSGMPLGKKGRFVVADRAELDEWLGRESHMLKSAHVVSAETDIASALKESLSAIERRND